MFIGARGFGVAPKLQFRLAKQEHICPPMPKLPPEGELVDPIIGPVLILSKWTMKVSVSKAVNRRRTERYT